MRRIFLTEGVGRNWGGGEGGGGISDGHLTSISGYSITPIIIGISS